MRFSEDRMEKLTCSDGQERNIHIWEPETPRMVFLAVHGLMDHGGSYVVPALFFRDHQIATVAHDLSGHDHFGPDDPGKVMIPRFEDLLEDLDLMIMWVKEKYPGLPIFILGHSMGGLVITHFGIRRLEADPQIKGFVASAPYFVNAVKTPWIMLKLAGVLSALFPRMVVPTEDFMVNLTHDEEIYNRHRKDEQDGVRVSKVSFGFAGELLKAQAWIPEHIARWKHPLLVIVAGSDKVADWKAIREMMAKIEPGLVTELYYPDNYHENFNELNRDEIFARIVEWVDKIS
jgi:lysophospholipase